MLDPDLADFQRVLWVVALVDSDLGILTDVVVALGSPSPQDKACSWIHHACHLIDLLLPP